MKGHKARYSQFVNGKLYDDKTGQHILDFTVVYAVYQRALESSERFSADEGLRLLEKYHRKKHAECILHFLKDRMSFKKSRIEGNYPFRSWVAYKEISGFHRDMKRLDMFMLMIKSQTSNVRYYEVYRVKHKEDIKKVEKLLRRALEDHESLLRIEGESASVSMLEQPLTRSRSMENFSSMNSRTIYRQSSSMSPTNRRSSMVASQSPRVQTQPSANYSNSDYNDYGPSTTRSLGTTPSSGHRSSQLPSAGSGSPMIQRTQAVPTSAVPKRQTSPPSIYSGGYPGNLKGAAPSRSVNMASAPSYQRSPSPVYELIYQNNRNGIEAIEIERSKPVSSVPVRQQQPSSTYSGSYPNNRTVECEEIMTVSSVLAERQLPSTASYRSYPSNSNRLQAIDRVDFIPISSKPIGGSSLYTNGDTQIVEETIDAVVSAKPMRRSSLTDVYPADYFGPGNGLGPSTRLLSVSTPGINSARDTVTSPVDMKRKALNTMNGLTFVDYNSSDVLSSKGGPIYIQPRKVSDPREEFYTGIRFRLLLGNSLNAAFTNHNLKTTSGAFSDRFHITCTNALFKSLYCKSPSAKGHSARDSSPSRELLSAAVCHSRSSRYFSFGSIRK
ncbi:unnamed protein product [Echinostoma caproni]|uniref:RUN domain-containing protein n=1 Tax=Echinostoma caproni TaxID=27848 RepID=A0A183A6A7_9TREM|nr:unnamed protein product [Echinostoma caproni]